ncbi:MAG: DUF1284 domain-containing protein [Gammaproteobacteria bacterium]|jgi:hypothetical protein
MAQKLNTNFAFTRNTLPDGGSQGENRGSPPGSPCANSFRAGDKNKKQVSQTAKLVLRTHHLICNLCFQGKGYNDKFVENFQKIHDAINDGAIITIVENIDDICAKCPEKTNNACSRETKVTALDQAYLNLLKLKPGQTITKQELLNKIKQHLTINDFHKICKNCPWYDANLCAPIINNVINK